MAFDSSLLTLPDELGRLPPELLSYFKMFNSKVTTSFFPKNPPPLVWEGRSLMKVAEQLTSACWISWVRAFFKVPTLQHWVRDHRNLGRWVGLCLKLAITMYEHGIYAEIEEGR